MYSYPMTAGAPLATNLSKVVSPSVDQDMKARGVAQVIAVLAPSAGASLAVADSGASAQRVESCFRSSERSHASAVRQALVSRTGAAAAAAILPPAQASITFPNLGVVLGTVDVEGLAALQASADVSVICGTPQISLIRPEHVAAAAAPAGITWGIEHLGVPALWNQGLTGKNVTVAHLDTGVDGTHPTLKNAVAAFAEFELSLGQRVTPDPAPHDSGDHGTHTAGTIAGRPLAGRHIGVAHGALLHSGLVIEGGNLVARVLGGLDWAIGNQVKIISMSLGFRGWWEDFIPIMQIIRSHGILPVIAVGNEGPGTSRSPGNYPTVLSVGAEDDQSTVARFSSSQTFARADDPLVPDLVAPGVDVISAAPNKAYQSMSGSSMATPHVAGLAALLWEAKPTATAADIEKAICDSCRLSGALTPDRANRGEPDARNAFTRLTGITLPPVATSVGVSAPPPTAVAAGKTPSAVGKKTAKRAVRRRSTKAAGPKTGTAKKTGAAKKAAKPTGARKKR
jgi:subtilisin family serine protease